MNRRDAIGHLTIAIFSLLAAFFGVFNVLFSDSSSVERLIALAGIFFGYTFLAVIFHLLWPMAGWIWVRWLVIPALIIGGFYLFQEFSSLSLYGVGVLAAAVAGATLGRELISRKRGQPTQQLPSA